MGLSAGRIRCEKFCIQEAMNNNKILAHDLLYDGQSKSSGNGGIALQ
jgi:hypothetical protein